MEPVNEAEKGLNSRCLMCSVLFPAKDSQNCFLPFSLMCFRAVSECPMVELMLNLSAVLMEQTN